MKLEILDENINRLLHRTELKCKLTFPDRTPSKEEVLKEITEKKRVDPQLVVIGPIRQKYGKKECTTVAKIYESVKALKKGEGRKREKVKKTKEEEEKPEAKEEKGGEPATEEKGEENAGEEKN